MKSGKSCSKIYWHFFTRILRIFSGNQMKQMLWQWVNLTDVSIYLAITPASLFLKRNWIVELYLRLSAKTVLSVNIKRKKIMLQKRGTESCQIIKLKRRGWITIMWIRTTKALREKSRQTMNGYNGLWTEGLFVALAAELQEKKNESESKIIIRKISLQLKKQRNSNRKGTGQFQNLRRFLCLSLLPRFPRFSLHQSSTNILPQMIYQMFAKVQVSTGIDLINISEKIIFLGIWIDEFDKSPKRWSSYSYICCTFGANILPIDCILRCIASLS